MLPAKFSGISCLGQDFLFLTCSFQCLWGSYVMRLGSPEVGYRGRPGSFLLFLGVFKIMVSMIIALMINNGRSTDAALWSKHCGTVKVRSQP